MKKIISICLLSMTFACNSEPANDITGIYVRGKKAEQKNYNSGKIIGTYQLMDTIIISKKEEGYQIDHHVWRNNDYDQNGWQQKYDGTIKTHRVKFDKTDNSLNTELNLYSPMYLDFENDLLYTDIKSNSKWKKVKP